MDWFHPRIGLSWIGLGLKSIFVNMLLPFQICIDQAVYTLGLYLLYELHLGSKRNAYCLFSWLSCRTVYDLNHWTFYYQLLFNYNYVANEILFIFCLETGGLSPDGWKWIGLDVGSKCRHSAGIWLDWVSKLLDWVLKTGPTDNSAWDTTYKES